jgi:ribose transport system substrate-binding protein
MHRLRWLSLLAIACVVGALVAGCGGSSSSSSSGGESSAPAEEMESGGSGSEAGGGEEEGEEAEGGSSDSLVSEAEKKVEEFGAEVTTWPGPEASKPIVKGKSFVVIPCSMAAEGCARQAEGFVEGAKAVGWKTKMIDPQGDINKTNAAIEQAITLGVDGIFLVSVDPKTVSGTLAEARKAGIEVIDSGAGGPQSKPSPTGLSHEVSLHGTLEGEMMGWFLIAHSGGKANIALINDSEFATVVERVEATKEILAKCPECDISQEMDIPVTAVGSTLGARIKSLLQANPDVEYVYSPYDSASNDIVQAIVEEGKQESVHVTGFNGNEQNLEYIREGSAQIADVAEALNWAGWAGVDDFNRIFNGEEPPKDDGVPAKLFTEDNLPEPGQQFEGEYDYQSKYKELWGVGG